jgi:hypothetical protein
VAAPQPEAAAKIFPLLQMHSSRADSRLEGNPGTEPTILSDNHKNLSTRTNMLALVLHTFLAKRNPLKSLLIATLHRQVNLHTTKEHFYRTQQNLSLQHKEVETS